MIITRNYRLRTWLRAIKGSFLLIGSLLTGSVSAQTVGQLADRVAIAEQVARYSYAADGKDLEAFLALYTEDAVWKSIPPGQTEPNMIMHNREEIRTFSADRYKQNAGIRTGHHQSGLLFTELTADTAKTQNMVLVTQQGAEDAAPRVVVSGVYYDTWKKTAAGWLITSRTLHMEPLPLTE